MKKLLALVLALVMTLGLATVGANVAFADADQIEHTEAVEVLNALGVVGGRENNLYDPTANVKRSEMAKMVTILMLGDVDVSAFQGAPTDLTDIEGHWAEAYMKFCYSQGIIGGRGNGKFDPDDNVTATEAAKMLLVAIGYNADVQGYGGDQWKVNVVRDAQLSGFYEELKALTANKALTRDETAQMVYNAGGATMIEKTSSISRGDGSIRDEYAPYADEDITLIHETFDGLVELGYLASWSFDSAKNQWTYHFTTGRSFGGAAIDADDALTHDGLKSTTNYTDFYGQRVKVVYNYKDTSVVYGIYAADSAVLAAGYTGDIGTIEAANSGNSAKVGDTVYKFDSNNNVANVGGYETNQGWDGTVDSVQDLKDITTAYSFKFIDNTDDGKVDAITYTPLSVCKVTWVGTDTVTIQGIPVTLRLEDCYFDGFEPAKDDYVVYVGSANSPTNGPCFQKLPLQTATVDAVRAGSAAATYDEYQLDSKWYERGVGSSLTMNTPDVNDTVEFIALGGKVYYIKTTDVAATTKQIAMVISSSSSTSDTGNSYKAKLLFADGSKKVVEISKVNGTKTSSSGLGPVTNLIGDLVTYKIDGDNYELTALHTTDNKAGYKTYAADVAAYSNKTIGGVEVAKDSVIYVYAGTVDNADADNADADNDGKVYTGQEFLNAYDSGVFGTSAQILTDTVDGFNYVRVAGIVNTDLPDISTGSNYAYLTENANRTNEGNDQYLNFVLWTADGKVEAKAKMSDSPEAFLKGTIITYDTTSTDGVIKNVNAETTTSGMISGWTEGATTGNIQFYGAASSKVNEDTTVLFIDSKEAKGMTTGTIRLADDTDSDDIPDYANVLYIRGGSALDLLVVDVNNRMRGAITEATYATELNTALSSGNVTIDASDIVNDGAITIPAYRTLTITGTLPTAQAIADGGANTTLIVEAVADSSLANIAVDNLEITGSLAHSATDFGANIKNITIDEGLAQTGALTVNSGSNGQSLTVKGLLTTDDDITVADGGSISLQGGLKANANGGKGLTLPTGTTSVSIGGFEIEGGGVYTIAATAGGLTTVNIAGDLKFDTNNDDLTITAGTALTVTGSVTSVGDNDITLTSGKVTVDKNVSVTTGTLKIIGATEAEIKGQFSAAGTALESPDSSTVKIGTFAANTDVAKVHFTGTTGTTTLEVTAANTLSGNVASSSNMDMIVLDENFTINSGDLTLTTGTCGVKIASGKILTVGGTLTTTASDIALKTASTTATVIANALATPATDLTQIKVTDIEVGGTSSGMTTAGCTLPNVVQNLTIHGALEISDAAALDGGTSTATLTADSLHTGDSNQTLTYIAIPNVVVKSGHTTDSGTPVLQNAVKSWEFQGALVVTDNSLTFGKDGQATSLKVESVQGAVVRATGDTGAMTVTGRQTQTATLPFGTVTFEGGVVSSASLTLLGTASTGGATNAVFQGGMDSTGRLNAAASTVGATIKFQNYRPSVLSEESITANNGFKNDASAVTDANNIRLDSVYTLTEAGVYHIWVNP